MGIQVHNLAYVHLDGATLLKNISFSISKGAKCAIIGANGSGKSTLLRMLAGIVAPTGGEIVNDEHTYLIPQHFGQYDDMTVGEAIGVSEKITALHNILGGDASESNFGILDDDWDIENKVLSALSRWLPEEITADTPMSALSGGEKTKVFIAAASIHEPELILMDEPTNHLDTQSREAVYDFISESQATVVVVSHDRRILNRLSSIYELRIGEMRYFPVPYDEYCGIIQSEQQSAIAQLENRQKELAKAKRLAQTQLERQSKQNTKGRGQAEKKGVPRIMMGAMKNRAELTTAKLADMQQAKLQAMAEDVDTVRASVRDSSAMKVNLSSSGIHYGKILARGAGVNHSYKEGAMLWSSGVDFVLNSGDRVRITGRNGSGKSTLLKMICGRLEASCGLLEIANDANIIYLDQEYSIIDGRKTVYEQLSQFNHGLREHELKIRLNRFLFTKETWDKPCSCLSGGERMKLVLCCLMISNNMPDIIIADEPTNNIDIENMEILARTLREYRGTLIVVSHDETFIEDIGITSEINLE
jgi:ATPase subunit of ABC transporter with duplicated ATPase domains